MSLKSKTELVTIEDFGCISYVLLFHWDSVKGRVYSQIICFECGLRIRGTPNPTIIMTNCTWYHWYKEIIQITGGSPFWFSGWEGEKSHGLKSFEGSCNHLHLIWTGSWKITNSIFMYWKCHWVLQNQEISWKNINNWSYFE